MMTSKITKKDITNLAFNQGSLGMEFSWNYERQMHIAFAMMMNHNLKKIYEGDEEGYRDALVRHVEFFNITPQLAPFVGGVVTSMEEMKARGEVDGEAIASIKTALMGPLSGIGDSIFVGCLRVIAVGIGISLAQAGNIMGPIIFFFGWNAIRMAFLWYTQEFGYKAGSEITKDMSGGILQDITKGASILGMFILAVLVQRWVSITFTVDLPAKQLSEGAYIVFPEGTVTGTELQGILGDALSGLSLYPTQAQTLQGQLDSLIPGLMGLLLTFLCMYLLKKKVTPITMIIGLFIVGILARFFGIM